ncbi:MAG: hypothetical protein IRZ02_07105 [Acidothermus sp.]|nr:hypothetical protein [Acidothermus sp.]MCL6538056.1 hypothetical protein [Acidothermus sp.]
MNVPLFPTPFRLRPNRPAGSAQPEKAPSGETHGEEVRPSGGVDDSPHPTLPVAAFPQESWSMRCGTCDLQLTGQERTLLLRTIREHRDHDLEDCTVVYETRFDELRGHVSERVHRLWLRLSPAAVLDAAGDSLG